MKPVQFSCQIEKISSNKDRTLTIKLETQELTKEDTSYLFDLQGKQIWAAFAETAVKKDDLNIPEVLMEFKTDKTPSERLRNVLYVYHQKNYKDQMTFEAYYKDKMNEIIERVKSKLE